MDRVLSTLETAERYVADNEFMAGRTFSAADIAALPITQSMKSDLPWPKLPNLRRWFERIEGRPSVKRGLQAFDRTLPTPPILQPGPDHRVTAGPSEEPK